ncbi:prothoracicostatic peptides [Cylas formicarius]|uniref:prothoracicostatic peptides n=1 Tax=Cylas formicarius TaxID=197179 RepID=UPI0029584CBD|nr:prothoracicostatic peptides [Cylas formicarius]XP_060531975.1 prothoracicostatic peptides [Cylas formicarius]
MSPPICSHPVHGKTAEKFLYVVAFACCFEAVILAVAANDVTSSLNSGKSSDDNLQLDGDLPKRDWNQNLKMWGKRGWNNLHTGWGKRTPVSWDEENAYSPSISEKRMWQNLQGGWGKRYIPSENELVLKQLEAAMEDQRSNEENDLDSPIEGDMDMHEFDKRNWNKFTDGWGKRSNNNKWDKFRGSWGKREPAWNNLKGIWGKRSFSE